MSTKASDFRVIIVVLRQPGRNADERRTDPLYEFGSFGLTRCHSKNLLSNNVADGARLAFAQGGPQGFRLVMLTPAVRLHKWAEIWEARWPPGGMPLKYADAPVLIDNNGASDVSGLAKEFAKVKRSTPVAKFASAFRSRKKELPRDVALRLVEVWDKAWENTLDHASKYWEALPREPPMPDSNRKGTYEDLRRKAGDFAALATSAAPRKSGGRC